ncbi:two-component system regulatory protein YycI [Thermoactinomyces sp. DSM 45892]|uniref:two-component system regulatory protein YycI n=1 Tax=Thermoactinomyces sp. DSM 45892 TaxID=1882753 RepID=UPI00089578B7|nr:two-component system regulatory protein YycI [Thermoactinomyces sp. DSM 45892]SDY37789.1 Two-component signal transduction system YycFG, regulatory protein YycI [Thermoactinomyces sp. DSM 45892]
MDWRKAKTILIIAFLILDLYIGSLLYANYRENDLRVAKSTLSDRQIEELAQYNDVKLAYKKIEVPKEMAVYSGVTTKLDPLSWKTIGDGIYQKELPTPTKVAETPSEVKAFLQKEKLPYLADYHFAKMEVTSSEITVYQVRDHFPIFNGTIKLKFNTKKEVKSISYTHYELKEPLPQTHRPNQLNNALASLLPQINKTTIQSAELGYQRNKYNKDTDSIMIPIWRFKVGGKFYYIGTTSSDSISSVQPATSN